MKSKVLLGIILVITSLIGLAAGQRNIALKGEDGGEQNPPPHLQPPPSPLRSALDGNGDGKISAEEMANAAANLAKMDTNGDGALTQEELRPPPPPGGAHGDRLMRLDTNKDGFVSQDEFCAPPRHVFATIDTDGSGFIDADEAANAPPPPPPPGGGPHHHQPGGPPQDGQVPGKPW
jgi:hypothetical protein